MFLSKIFKNRVNLFLFLFCALFVNYAQAASGLKVFSIGLLHEVGYMAGEMAGKKTPIPFAERSRDFLATLKQMDADIVCLQGMDGNWEALIRAFALENGYELISHTENKDIEEKYHLRIGALIKMKTIRICSGGPEKALFYKALRSVKVRCIFTQTNEEFELINIHTKKALSFDSLGNNPHLRDIFKGDAKKVIAVHFSDIRQIENFEKVLHHCGQYFKEPGIDAQLRKNIYSVGFYQGTGSWSAVDTAFNKVIGIHFPILNKYLTGFWTEKYLNNTENLVRSSIARARGNEYSKIRQEYESFIKALGHQAVVEPLGALSVEQGAVDLRAGFSASS